MSMKGAIFILVLVVAGVVGLGFYMDWFHLSSGSDDNKASISLSVDRGKVQEDKDKAVKKVQDVGQEVKDKATPTTEKAKE
jgi:hypothetical protein